MMNGLSAAAARFANIAANTAKQVSANFWKRKKYLFKVRFDIIFLLLTVEKKRKAVRDADLYHGY